MKDLSLKTINSVSIRRLVLPTLSKTASDAPVQIDDYGYTMG